MLQLVIVLLSYVACGLAGYSDSASGNDIGNNNFGYGYSGSYSGTGNPPENFPFPHFDFSNLLNNFQRFQQDLQKSILGQAEAAQNFGRSGAAGGGYGGAGGFGGGYSGGHSFGGSFSGSYPGGEGFQFVPGAGIGGTFTPDGSGASAFGYVGQDGIQQRAGVFPENPNSPNVNVRFGAADPNGFKSVFTSSSSVTSDVDGQPKTVKQATTTMNDNGKITTYTAKSP